MQTQETLFEPTHGHDWNVLATAREGRFKDAKRILKRYGQVVATPYYNVLALKVVAVEDFLRDFACDYLSHDYFEDAFSKVLPAMELVTFSNKDEFERKLEAAWHPWLGKLNNNSFHLRIHRRGDGEYVRSEKEEERYLAKRILEALWAGGMSAQVEFDDPDFVIDVEMLENRAGVSIWEREMLKACSFLRVD